MVSEQIVARAKQIALVISDNDGVLTDGSVYMTVHGEELKRYSVRDGMGFERLHRAGIATAILTREPPALIARRAVKLGVSFLWTGVRDKRAHLDTIMRETGLRLDQLAYIGDDVNDLELIDAIGAHGITAAPADAMPVVAASVHVNCTVPGGNGAFRELAEWLLRHHEGGSR